MGRWILVIVIGLLMAACGGDSDSEDGGVTETTGANGTGSSQPDPCTLAGDSVLATYFGDAVPEFERTEAGPIAGCRWRNESADSLLIQVATDFDLFRPENCDECVDLPFGDDGYASESPLQSGATFIDGGAWYSVTTTGFRDDIESITALAEKIFENATG